MLSNFILPINPITLEVAEQAGISLSVVRADKIHPLASGNKLYKLQPNIDYMQQQSYPQALSFGGAFSNHIHALALYTQSLGIDSIGIIRGEEKYASNPTLSAARQAGMTLVFVDRSTYRRRHNEDYLQDLQSKYPKAFIIPEGGSNKFALQGCRILMQQINKRHLEINGIVPDVITVACGTGTTFSGLVAGATHEQSVQAYLVVKDPSVHTTINTQLGYKIATTNHSIHAADFGGYAKFDIDLLNFILDFLAQTNILLDPIYSSKMCKKLTQQIEDGKFISGTCITIVHSGGLQAWLGMKAKVIQIADEEVWNKIAAKIK
ncbi:MAG TPA: pyridoxal-phosphate dependent enzyme [Leucothrix mucor]|nr:pyridoxal-phosphate dependent enzyme [Leucothrix mucor]